MVIQWGFNVDLMGNMMISWGFDGDMVEFLMEFLRFTRPGKRAKKTNWNITMFNGKNQLFLW